MAENENVENTTEQDSPTVETNQPEVETTDAAEKLEETPEVETEGQPDKNWKAVREELRELKEQNDELRGKVPQEPAFDLGQAKESQVVNPWLTQEDKMALQFDEMKALNQYEELDPDSDSYDELFDIAVSGQYRAELDRYAKGLITGQRIRLPSAHGVAKKMRKKYDTKFKAKADATAAQKEKAVEAKQATAEAEGRSDKRTPRGEDHEVLRDKSRRGDNDAIAERLARSEL
jgi:hypothetical protein